MEKRRILNSLDVKPELRCLIKKFSCKAFNMMYWLTVPEFVAEIEPLVHQKVWITDETVLPIMQKILDKKAFESDNGRNKIDFEFGTAKTAIRQIKRAIEKKQASE